MQDVIIIGAGIIGSSIARELSKYQLNISVLEAESDVSMGSSKANSGIVHGGYAESHDTLKGSLCYQGRRKFKKLNQELNFGFEQNGSMVLAFHEEELKILQDLLENGRKNGLLDLRILTKEEIIEKEPNINPNVLAALYCEGAGICSPYEMTIAMMENAIHNGVTLHLNAPVCSITKEKAEEGEIFHVRTQNGTLYTGRYVINAAGIRSQQIAEMLGDFSFKITPRTGQYMIFGNGSGEIIHSVLFQIPSKMGKGILVTPTYHGNLLIGPDALDENRANSGTNMLRLLEIYQTALLTTDSIDSSKIIRTFSGVRAVSNTNDFIIKESSVKGLIHCAGIQSPGLTSSPAIAERVIQILQSSGLALVENPNFDSKREPILRKKKLKNFAEIKDLLEISSEDQIICRCEQIDRKTIIDAVSRGIEIHSVDAIKRRTRAGMGYCQGEFCRPRVLKLMKEITGKHIDDRQDYEANGVERIKKDELRNFLKK